MAEKLRKHIPSEFKFQPMKLKILGTRGKIEASAPNHKNHTGFLLDSKILIDVGEPEYMKYDPEAIVFTHFHPDHAFFVAEKEKFAPKIPLFGPEPQEFLPDLKIISEMFRIGDYSFTPVPVIHALKLKSLGYIIEKNRKRIFITGDVAWIEKANLENLPKLDLIITEATFINKGGRINRKKNKIFGHTGIPNLIRLLGPLTKKIVFTHYGNWFFEDVEQSLQKLRSLQEEDGPDIIPGHDGMEIEI